MYAKGQGVEQDDAMAFKWIQKAAEQEIALPQYKYILGNMFYRGQGVKQNYAKALKWYRRAAEHSDKSIYDNVYETDFTQNDAKLIRKDRNKITVNRGDARAQNKLGVMYYKGQGTSQNFKKAAKWFRAAAEQGHVDAQYFLGLMYDHGQGVEKDFDEAHTWIRKAARQGHEAALIWTNKVSEQKEAQTQMNIENK